MKTQKINVDISTPSIAADKLLKLAGAVSTGGQAFFLIEQGLVRLNGSVISEKRRQCHVGDRVSVDDRLEIAVTAAAAE